MARYSSKQPIRLSTTVRDVTGTLTDAGTLTLTVSKPDATTQSYSTPTHDGTGLYHQDIPIADLGQLGHYQYEWVSTGIGAGESFGDFDVFDGLAEAAVLPLQDAKDQLNIPQTTTTYDAEIQSWIATIGTSLEAMTGGPLITRTVTERAEFTSDAMALQLRQRPIVSVTSIVSVPNGAAVDISGGLDIDALAGVVYTQSGCAFGAFSTVATVTYKAGWGAAIPAAFNLAARIIIDHFWQLQHGPAARPSMGGEDLLTQVPGFPYAIPNGAAELLNGSLNGLPFCLWDVFA